MNREIKFRVWHKIRERYYDVEMIDFVREEVSYIFDNHIQQIRYWVNFEDSVIEQYTGLKDKNGVEIFEGGILKITIDFSDVGGGYLEELLTFSMDFEEYVRIYQLMSNGASIEVIGNVNKNKELL